MYAGHQMLLAAHVQEGFLLPGEGCFRQIFGGGGGTHGDGEFLRRAACRAHRAPGIEKFLVQPLRKRSGQHPAADLRSDDRQPLDVLNIKIGQRVADSLIESLLRQEVAVGMRRGGETAGHRNAEIRQPRDHFADGSVLAADQFDVFISQLLERNDVGLHVHCL